VNARPDVVNCTIQDFLWDGSLVAIGASLGGIEALAAVVSCFPVNGPATLIVQHLPAPFIGQFVRRMSKLCQIRVEEAFDGAPLDAGAVYVAPGTRHLGLSITPAGLRCRLIDSEPVHGFKPSIDVLFRSVAETAGSRSIGVIMSGMGRDGVDGLLAMRKAGARTLGQDALTSVVYGMPKAAFEIGAVERQVPIGDLAREILALCNNHSRGTRG
jgi:two-component system chemotaxis response regulator CheB